jgi:hypothetical protein
MPLESLDKLSSRELTRRAEEAFAQLKTCGYEQRAALLLEAQFYIQERDRRHDSWISFRDLILELVIIALIGWEVHEGNKQYDLLQTMNANTAATVTAVKNLQQAQDASLDTLKDTLQSINSLNDAAQKELGVNYRVSAEIVFLQKTRQLSIGNKGRTNLMFWGGRVGVGDIPAVSKLEPEVVPPGGFYYLEVPNVFAGFATLPKGENTQVPFEMYLQTEDGTKFTARGYLSAVWESQFLKFNTRTISIRPEKWSMPTTAK